jgi:hypothetical protein
MDSKIRTKSDCVGEGQVQFTWPTDIKAIQNS